LKSSDVLKISTSYQDGKLDKGGDYNVEEPGRQKGRSNIPYQWG